MNVEKNYFLILLLKICFILILGYGTGIFSHLNQYIYNQIFSYYPAQNEHHKEFILVDASSLEDKDIVRLIDKINTQHPKYLVSDIFHHIDFSIEAFVNILNEHPHTIFALPIGNNYKYFENYKKNLSERINAKRHIGLYTLGNLYSNTYFEPLHSLSYDNLFSLLSTHPDKSKDSMKYVDHYAINYNANPPFAKIHASSILDDNTINTMFKDKIIILSNYDNNYVISRFTKQFSEGFHHQTHMAFMLKSAIYNEWLKHLSLKRYILILLVFTIIIILASYMFLYSYIIPFIVITSLSLISIYIISSIYSLWILPITEFIIILISVSFFVLKHSQKKKSKNETNFINMFSLRLKDKVVHNSFFNSKNRWDEIIGISQNFYPFKKSVFIEKFTNNHTLTIGALDKCTVEDIQEKNKNIMEEPYLSVLTKKSTLELKDQYFYHLDTSELEFICPLLIEGNLMGFWIFTIDDTYISDIDTFKHTIDLIAKEMSKLLYDYQQFQLNKKYNRNNKLQDLKSVDTNFNMLKGHFGILEKRLLLNETLYNNTSTNLVSYNLFGTLISMNKSMEHLFNQENIRPYTLSSMEMILAISDIKQESVVEIFHNAFMKQKPCTLFFEATYTKKRYLLIVTPVTHKDIESKFTVDYIFETYGILFNFIDLTFSEKIYTLKDDIVKSSLHAMEQRYTLLDNSLKSLLENNIHHNINSDNIQAIREHVFNMHFKQNQLELLMNQKITKKENDQYPIKVLKNIENISNTVKQRHIEKQLKITITSPTFLPLALVSINTIEGHLETLLEFMAHDCQDQGHITIDICNDEKFITIQFQSDGYGIPNNQLMSYIFNDTTAPNIYKDLYITYKAIQSWSGDIQFSSELGEGITITLSFLVITL